MARFHLDQHVSYQIAALLRAAGHDVETAYEVGLAAADDDVHLFHAAQERRMLLTHNAADFLLLHKAWLRWSRGWGYFALHGGIIACPQAPLWRPPDATDQVLLLLGRAGRMENQFWAYDRQTGA